MKKSDWKGKYKSGEENKKIEYLSDAMSENRKNCKIN